MWSIKLDNQELIDSAYNLGRILDDSTAPRDLNTIRTEGVDGVVVLDDRFDAKTIEMRGMLTAATPAALQTAIDNANELFSRKDVNLDITPDGGSARRYIVRLIGSVIYEREHFHNTFVPWRARFFVAEGIGRATTETSALSVANIATERSPTPSGSHAPDFDGSADPRPTLTIHIDTKGKADLITLTDDDTSEETKILLDDGVINGDDIVIDLEQEIVTLGATQIGFTGKLPEFEIGVNNLHLDIQGATQVLDQSQTNNGTGTVIGNNGAGLTRNLAQSFVAGESGYLKTIKVYVAKSGTPGSFQVRIFTDNGGKPYQNLVSGESGWVEPQGSFGGAAEVTLDNASSPYYLRAGEKYWMVITTTNNSGNYYIVYGSGATDNYAAGELLKNDDAVTPPADPADYEDFTGTIADLYFKTYQGEGGSPDWQIDFDIDYTKRYL